MEDKISSDRSLVFPEQEMSELFISFCWQKYLDFAGHFFSVFYILHAVWELIQLKSISVVCDKPLELSRPAKEDA